jgi:DNA-binding CsgD family transcriptional regulator
MSINFVHKQITDQKNDILQLLTKNIQPPFTPSNLDIAKFWDDASNPILPRTCMYIMNIPADTTFRSKGMSLLGLEDQQAFSAKDHLALTHDNQLLQAIFHSTSLYGVFIKNSELLKDKGVVFCESRGIKHAKEPHRCFLVHQVAFPIQYDCNDLVVKYFCNYRIIGKYDGEAFQTQVYTSPQFPHRQYQLREILDKPKKKLLKILGFTRMEEEIIRYIASGQAKISSVKIAQRFRLAVKTIRNHRNNINRKAKELFPLNDFKDTEDVVKYLKQQRII